MGLVALAAGALACSRGPKPDVADASPRVVAPAPAQAPAPPAAPARPRLALFYSSDLRGRATALASPKQRVLPPGVELTPLAPRETRYGLARRATVVDRGRLDADDVVQVDAGDFLPLAGDEPRDAAAPGPKDLAKGEGLVIAAYRRMGVDGVTLGERELRPGADLRKLAARLEKAHVPVVLANLTDKKGAAVFPADRLIDAKNAGLKVGIFGVTELGEAETAALAKAGYALTDPAAAARAAAAGLRARGATFVVALVHAARGRARAAELVAGLTDLDVAVASLGHDEGAAAATSEGRPRVVAAGGFQTVGRLEVSGKDGGPLSLTDAVVPLDEGVREQLGVNLLSRVETIQMFDSNELVERMKRKNSGVRMIDLYEQWDYGSTKACGYCHEKAVKQWETTSHATALATLKRGKRDRDKSCLGCHVMGFLQTGGTRDWVMVKDGFANVGCEACHGPSAEHVRSVDKKLGTSRKVDAITCLGCHTPDQNLSDFDPIASMKEILGPGHGAP